MPYPASLAAGYLGGNQLTVFGANWTTNGFPCAAINIGGNLFQASLDSVGTSVQVSKSTDLGLTWTVVGSTPTAVGTGIQIACVKLQGVLLAIICPDPSLAFWQMNVYDTTTDTWTANIVTAQTVSLNFSAIYACVQNDQIVCAISESEVQTAFSIYFVLDSSDGSVIFSGDLGDDPTLPWGIIGVVSGDGLETVFLLVSYDFDTSTRFLSYQLWDGAVLGSVVLIDFIASPDASSRVFAIGRAASDGAQIGFVLVPEDLFATIRLSVYLANVIAKVFTLQTIGPDALLVPVFDIAIGDFGTTVFVVHSDGMTFTGGSQTDTGSGFGAFVEAVGVSVTDTSIVRMNAV